ncbi:MAG: DMT family transporter [Pseudomonadota bacterium]|nr:DMT family transporter [Pseudomonadota bacterium]
MAGSRQDSGRGVSRDTLGMLLGILGVAGFSVTLPATRVAVHYLDPLTVGLGRALVAAVGAALMLWLTRQSWPTTAQIKGLVIVALGVIIGFPLFSAIALQQLPAAHGAVIVAILPLLTAVVGAVRMRQRPSNQFWLMSLLGSLLVLMFAFSSGLQGLQQADGILLLACLAAAFGYVEGGKLAREMGGWQVICWALVLIAPFLLAPVGWSLYQHGFDAPLSGWLAFFYVSLVSQFLAFFLWYQGMALAGVVRVSQMQLLQPFMTLLVAAAILDETVTSGMIVFALAVVATVAFGRRMPIVQH